MKAWLKDYNDKHKDSPFVILDTNGVGKDVIGLVIERRPNIQLDAQPHVVVGGGTHESGSAVHHGVTCDVCEMCPIVGKRYKKRGENYDLCEAEFGKLSPEDKQNFVCIEHMDYAYASRTQRLGVSVSDYFHFSLVNDPTERAYERSMSVARETIKRLVAHGILCDSLSYEIGRFDILEWLGDAILHLELTNDLITSRSYLLGVGGMTPMRINAEQRLTLARIFDDLRLARFVRRCPPGGWNSDLWKCKGDFVEAIMGELADRLNDASNRGVPAGHPERETVKALLKTFAQAALHRGGVMKDSEERKQLTEMAKRPGGGGFRITIDDTEAPLRCRK